MDGLQSRLTHRYRVRWAISMVLVAILVASAITCLYLVQDHQLRGSAWTYLSLTVAVLAALFGFGVTLAEGMLENNLTSTTGRVTRAKNIRRHRRQNDG